MVEPWTFEQQLVMMRRFHQFCAPSCMLCYLIGRLDVAEERAAKLQQIMNDVPEMILGITDHLYDRTPLPR